MRNRDPIFVKGARGRGNSQALIRGQWGGEFFNLFEPKDRSYDIMKTIGDLHRQRHRKTTKFEQEIIFIFHHYRIKNQNIV